MIISRSRYELEKERAERRIEELEHLLCPNSHDYVKQGEKIVAYDTLYGCDLYHDAYKCSRCGKEIER